MKKWQTLLGLAMCLWAHSQSYKLYYKQSVFNITNTPDCNYTRNLMFEVYPLANSTYKFVDYEYLYSSNQYCFDWPFCLIDKYKEQQNGFSEKTDFGKGATNGVLAHNYDIQGLGYSASVGGCSTTPIKDVASVNFDYHNYYTKVININLSGFNNEIKYFGEFVNVPLSKTYPILTTPNVNGVISGTVASLKAPDFLVNNFREQDLFWEISSPTNPIYDGNGHSVLISMAENSKCQPITAKVSVKNGYGWISSTITFEFRPLPNLELGSTLLVTQPMCVSEQYFLGGGKADQGSLKLGSSVVNRKFLVNFNNHDESLYAPSEQIDLSVANSPYNFMIKEDLGNDVKSCPQYLNNVEIKAPKPIEVSAFAFTDIKCFGEEPYLTVNVTGPAGKYTWIYDDSIRGTILTNQTQKLLLQKGSRDYRIRIEDDNYCRYDKPLIFTATEPSQMKAWLDIDSAVCYNGNATVRIVAQGGTEYDETNPYRYSFLSAVNTQIAPQIVSQGGSTLHPKVYDKNDCLYEFPSLMLFNPKDFKLVVKEHIDNICPKGQNARLLISCDTEDKKYIFSYSKDGKAYGNDSSFQSLPAGFYTLHAQNQKGCHKDTTLQIKQPPLLQITQNAMDSVRCHGDNNGSITLGITGGTGTKKLWMDKDPQLQGLRYEFVHTYNSLARGVYWFHVADSLGCKDSVAYTIGTRSNIQHAATLTKPTCFESNNGQIDVFVSGGKPPYNHTWVGHPELGYSAKQTKLSHGSYILWSTDKLSCVKVDTFTLVAPPALEVNLNGYPLLCKGQTLELDAGSEGGRYDWAGNNGFKANSRKVVLDKSGTYWVWVRDYNNCKGSDTITIRQSDTEFKADFLVATTVVQGDTVVLLNDNVAIDSLVWKLDPSNTLKLPKSPDFRAQEAVFKELGTFEVQLEAYYKGCRDTRTRKIVVIPPSERLKNDQAIGIKTSVVKACQLYPNPNDGSFDVLVDLNENGVPIALTLSSMVTGTVLKRLDWKIYHDGKITFQEDLPEGPYVVHVKVRDEVLALRFLVAYD